MYTTGCARSPHTQHNKYVTKLRITAQPNTNDKLNKCELVEFNTQWQNLTLLFTYDGNIFTRWQKIMRRNVKCLHCLKEWPILNMPPIYNCEGK